MFSVEKNVKELVDVGLSEIQSNKENEDRNDQTGSMFCVVIYSFLSGYDDEEFAGYNYVGLCIG